MVKNPHSPRLDALGLFLLDLRNAFSHSREELVPRFSKKDKAQNTLDPNTKGTFKINIPVKTLENGYEQFDPASSSYKMFKMTVRPGKKIKIDQAFINEIYDLSMHVLTITKKQKN